MGSGNSTVHTKRVDSASSSESLTSRESSTGPVSVSVTRGKKKKKSVAKKTRRKISSTVIAIAKRHSKDVEQIHVAKRKKMKKKAKNETSRISPYACYVREYFKEYRRRNPEVKLNFVAVSRECAKQWHALSMEMRAEYQKMAARENDRLLLIHKIISDVKPTKQKNAKLCTKSKTKIVEILTPKNQTQSNRKATQRSFTPLIKKGLVQQAPNPTTMKSLVKKQNCWKCRECGKTVKDLTKRKLKRCSE